MFRGLNALVLLSCLFSNVSCLLSFTNPPNSDDASRSLEYVTGDTLNVAWRGGVKVKAVSIVLFHLNDTTHDALNDGMEYVLQNSLNDQLVTWLVGTRKDLTVSNLFYLSIFQEGNSPADSNSHYFNITTRDATVSRISSSSLSPSTTLSSLSSSSTSSASSTTSLSTSVTSSTLAYSSPSSVGEPTGVTNSASGPGLSGSSSDSFPASAKIGLGVGIPFALLLGAAVGFLLFRRYKKREMTIHATAHNSYPPSELYSPSKSQVQPYYARGQHEAPMKSPVEMS